VAMIKMMMMITSANKRLKIICQQIKYDTANTAEFQEYNYSL
jgi:hypothetical protein